MSTVQETSYTELAELFVKEMLKAQENTTGNLYVGLSGGSTLPPLLKAISTTEDADKLSQVVFTFIDERLVPYHEDGSNFGAMKEDIDSCGLKVLPLPCEDSQAQGADYQKVLGGDKLPELAMLLLGFGDDGHIASLFPGSAELEKDCAPGDWLFRARASYAPEERWSWGMEALTNSKKTYCLYKGPADGAKAGRLNDALNDAECDTPLARFMKAAKSDVTNFRVS
ncbi:MAG: 6-phosphogluconolactonase [Lentisphaeraceae bacterium]|nr:6-phosphogluconolactonase [Lentisphaeraceae bacterium]